MATDHTRDLRLSPRSESAWRDWFLAVYPRVYFTVYRITGGDPERTEDLTQAAIERFLRYRALDKVTTDDDSVAYLIRTAHRLNIGDRIRERTARLATRYAPGYAEAEDYIDEEEERFYALDIARMIDHLSEGDRQLISWHLAGQSITDIANSLGIAYTAAAVRIHRAKIRLRRIAEEM